MYTLNTYSTPTPTQVPYFSPFRSRTSYFADTSLRLLKIGNVANDLSLNVNTYNVTFRSSPVCGEQLPLRREPNFSPFHATTIRFRDTRLREIQWPQSDLEQLQVPCIHLITPPTLHRGPNLVCFTLRSADFKIQSCRKSEMHRVTRDWPWTPYIKGNAPYDLRPGSALCTKRIS